MLTFTKTEMEYPERVDILGIGVDPVTMQEAAHRVKKFFEEGVPRMIVTADASGIVQAQSDRQLKDIYENADLVTPDSYGVVWASKRTKDPIFERVTGVELMEEICKMCAANGYSLFLLGSAPGVAEKARIKIQEKYPTINIVGTHHGYFSKEEEPEIVAEISSLRPQGLIVAMGIPRQEIFIRDNMHLIGASVNIGVGGSFDVLSGNVKRAPVFIQKMRLEWLWRLIMNPRKWKKVLTLPKFVWMVITSSKKKT